jgi:hypothetical protein
VLAFHQHLFGRPDTGVFLEHCGIANLSVRRAVDAKVYHWCWPPVVPTMDAGARSTPVNPMTRRLGCQRTPAAAR